MAGGCPQNGMGWNTSGKAAPEAENALERRHAELLLANSQQLAVLAGKWIGVGDTNNILHRSVVLPLSRIQLRREPGLGILPIPKPNRSRPSSWRETLGATVGKLRFRKVEQSE